MNGTSGFREAWSSTSRSPVPRFFHEQQHRSRTDAWRLSILIPLLTTVLSISVVCSLAADDRDTITLTNPGSGEIALWVSETKNNSIKSTVVKGSTGTSTFTGTFSGEPGAVIAYTGDHPPTLISPVPWTNGVDTTTMTLDKMHRIPLTVWIVNVGDSNFETIERNALAAKERTSQIWSRERQGIAFSSFDIIDATGKKDRAGNIVADRFRSQTFDCDITIKENLNGIGFKDESINVYYVQTVRTDGDDLSTGGQYCAANNFIALGVDSFEDLLAHELGHAFNIEHVDHLVPTHFDKTNVMHPKSKIRNFLTEGQTFRAVANEGSAINILYKTRADSAPKVKCGTSDRITAHDCPPIQRRIWGDGGENGTSRGPDSDDGQIAARHKTKPGEKPDPLKQALQDYIDLDHEDVLGKAGEKNAPFQTLQKVLKFKKVLEPEFIRFLEKGPDPQALQEHQRFLEEQWTRRAAFLAKNLNSGLTEDDLAVLRSITKQEYVNQGRRQLTQRYREKAIGALYAINTPTAKLALKNFRMKTKNKVLKEIIDRKDGNLPPQKPGGLKVTELRGATDERERFFKMVKEMRLDGEAKRGDAMAWFHSGNESRTTLDGMGHVSPTTIRGWPPGNPSKQPINPQVRRPSGSNIRFHR